MSEARPTTFKIAQLNAENLFIYLDDKQPRDWRNLSEKAWQNLSHATVANKPLLKVLWLAETLLAIDADVVALNEVGGLESIENFCNFFLGGHYQPYLIEGNSDRGIDIGYLVKKTLPWRFQIKSHKDRPLQLRYPHERLPDDPPSSAPIKHHYFSRDCAELSVFAHASSQPFLVVLLVHLKSKLDPDNIDPMGKQRRRAEFNLLLNIYRDVRARQQPSVPVIVAGDFNGGARRDQLAEEFRELVNTDLQGVFEAVGLSGESAATQLQFSRGGGMQALQIDYLLISPELKTHLLAESVEVYRYRSDLGVALALPKTLEQRLTLPSDHYPIVASFRAFWP